MDETDKITKTRQVLAAESCWDWYEDNISKRAIDIING